MHRTKVYLTDEQIESIEKFTRATGKKLSQLIRETIDMLLKPRREEAWKLVAGIWEDRDDLPDFEKMRDEWDRDECLEASN